VVTRSGEEVTAVFATTSPLVGAASKALAKR
jgi:hypothetical protein